MIFPIGDDNVVGGCKPIFSYAFIGLNIIIFLLQVSIPGNLICEYATIPQDIIHGKGYYTLITSMFMHGGWMHLIGNMVFLWVFGDNIEATVGNFRFLLFYIFGGLAASAAHIYFSQGSAEDLINCCKVCDMYNPCDTSMKPCSGYIPSLGASGAIAAVMGAYLVMFPKSKIKMIVLILFKNFKIPAYIFLALWFGQQLLSGIGGLGLTTETAGVAWWAHIGGFLFGVFFGLIYRSKVVMKTEVGNPTYV